MTALEMVLHDLKTFPDEFKQYKFTLNFRPKMEFDGFCLYQEYSVWTCSGFWFYELHEPARLFSLIDKIRFHFAYKKWSRQAPPERRSVIQGIEKLIIDSKEPS